MVRGEYSGEHLVTKVAYGCTDQCFAVSRGTLNDHGKG